MALGLGVLRLAPAHFWAMSLPEFTSALEGITGAAWAEEPISRRHFGALVDRYPDNPDQQET